MPEEWTGDANRQLRNPPPTEACISSSLATLTRNNLYFMLHVPPIIYEFTEDLALKAKKKPTPMIT